MIKFFFFFFFFSVCVCENNTSHFGSHLVEDHNGKRLGRKVRIIFNYKFWLPKITKIIINKMEKRKEKSILLLSLGVGSLLSHKFTTFKHVK